MREPLTCPQCGRSGAPGDSVCFHCRAVLDPFTRGARIADRYVIEETIGQGGMGRVYRAYDEALHEKVAIKTLLPEFYTDPNFLTRFRDEVRLARRVAHPNVCRVHDYVDHAGTPFLSMEWVEGQTLAERLALLGPRPEAELQVVREDVTAALSALWANGIVHRDLKPANLMWTLAGRVKLMDLGLARALLGAGVRDRTSGVIGSPEYLSPEQIRGEAATEKSDAYALGVSLFELASGHPPFRGDSPAQTLLKHLSDVPDASALASLSEGLRSTILRLLEKNPRLRPDLRERENEGAPAPARMVEVGAAGTPSRPVAWAASVAALLGVIAAAVYFGGGSPSVPRISPSPSPAAALSPFSSPSPSVAETAQSERPVKTPSVSRAPEPLRPATPLLQAPSPTVAPTPVPGPSSTPNAPVPPPTPLASAPAANLTPTPASAVDGRLIVVVTPWAEVFVNGDRKGLTPLPALSLPPGSHIVELRHPDYRPFLRTLELKAGEQVRMSVNLRVEGIRR